MGRKHTFMDREFRGANYDADDEGEFEPNLVFVMMSFRDDMRGVYSVIKDGCEQLGLRAGRVDEGGGSGIVLREITELIERAEFIVCDLTFERPNVYYELGYAHAVGNESDEILLIARKGTEIHFDIAALRINYYESDDHLRKIVADQLSAMIRATRG
jgi:hypothetical protein